MEVGQGSDEILPDLERVLNGKAYVARPRGEAAGSDWNAHASGVRTTDELDPAAGGQGYSLRTRSSQNAMTAEAIRTSGKGGRSTLISTWDRDVRLLSLPANVRGDPRKKQRVYHIAEDAAIPPGGRAAGPPARGCPVLR